MQCLSDRFLSQHPTEYWSVEAECLIGLGLIGTVTTDPDRSEAEQPRDDRHNGTRFADAKTLSKLPCSGLGDTLQA